MPRYKMVVCTFLTSDRGHIRVTKLGGRLDQGVEHSVKIEGRAADDLEHVGGSRLLLQRFSQLIQKARVLDGDHRLVGEGGNELDLLLCKRFHPLARHCDDANGRSLSQQRNAEYRAKAVHFHAPVEPIFRIRQDIGDLNGLAFHHRSSGNGPASQLNRMTIHELYEIARVTETCDVSVHVTSLSID